MAEELETVSAELSIEVNVDCPSCGWYIDLLNERDTNGNDHNDDGYVLTSACGDGQWTELHQKFEVNGVTCSQCKTEFNVKGMEW